MVGETKTRIGLGDAGIVPIGQIPAKDIHQRFPG